jgi:hypothetical protein
MNAWLLDKCIGYVKSHRHPELTDKTIWEVFEAERPKLVPYAGRFDGFHAVPASVSKTCLVRFDNNKYSVAASAVGRPVEVHLPRLDTDLAHADRDTIVRNFISGQYEDALRVVSFNVAEGWPRDVSEDIAGEIIDRAYDVDNTLGSFLFVEGRPAGPPPE